MTIIFAMTLIWMGILYHYYPVLTNRTLDDKLGNTFCWLFSIGAIGAALVMLAAGADGMPRRHADWAHGGWMIWGDLILLFGSLMALAFILYAMNMIESRRLERAKGAVPAAEPAE